MTDHLAVRRIERGVLPHCEAVRLVPALGGQSVLCKWSDVNLFPNYILGFKMLSKTYCWDRPCWNTQWAGLVQSALDPLARLFRETTGSEIQTTFLCKMFILLSCLGPVFRGLPNQVIGKCETANMLLASQGSVSIQPQMDICQQHWVLEIFTDFLCFSTCCLQTVQIGKWSCYIAWKGNIFQI